MSEQTFPVAGVFPNQDSSLEIRRRFVRCALSTAVNLGGSQVLRLASNLVLTRMLFPEAFGLMALVNVFLIGLAMFSDVGIGPSIIHRPANPSNSFLQTAWTVQIIRSAILFAGTVLLAFPLAAFYKEPQLLAVMPVVGLTQLVAGFKSTAVHVCARELLHDRIALVDLLVAVIGIVVTVLLAFIEKSVWALVWGGFVSSCVAVALSFLLPHQTPVRLRLERKIARELFEFGKWIFVGTALTYLASQGDRLILGKILSLEELGVYTVAFFFAQSVSSMTRGLASRVLFPVMSRLRQSSSAEQFREIIRYRRQFLGGVLLPVATLLFGGQWLIEFLYDDRYTAAGPMLQVLSLGAAASTMVGLADPVLLANGNFRGRMWLSFAEAGFLLLCMGAGGMWLGLHGFILGYVASQFLSCLAAHYLLRPYRLCDPITDGAFYGTLVLMAVVSQLFHPLFP